jgi:hypothetical protein
MSFENETNIELKTSSSNLEIEENREVELNNMVQKLYSVNIDNFYIVNMILFNPIESVMTLKYLLKEQGADVSEDNINEILKCLERSSVINIDGDKITVRDIDGYLRLTKYLNKTELKMFLSEISRVCTHKSVELNFDNTNPFCGEAYGVLSYTSEMEEDVREYAISCGINRRNFIKKMQEKYKGKTKKAIKQLILKNTIVPLEAGDL